MIPPSSARPLHGTRERRGRFRASAAARPPLFLLVLAGSALGCQLLIEEKDTSGAGGSRTTSSGVVASTGASMTSTGGGTCDESTVFTPPSADLCGDLSQCSGFCADFATACGNGFTDFKNVCCKACKAMTESAPGSPFCCRDRLLDAALAKPSVCTSVPLGDGTSQCSSPQRNFCAVAIKACTNLTEMQCTSAKPDVATKCLPSALKAFTDVAECVNLISCISG